MKKNKFLSIIISFILVFSFAFTNISSAAQAPAYSPTSSISSGSYMYYAVYGEIYKVNTNTKKTTLVKSIDDKSVCDLIVSNGWIYFTAIDSGISSKYKPYIYKVRTNGKDLKKLTKGDNPVIYNDKIYYRKVNFNNSTKYDYDIIGIYRMSLSGTSDSCIKKASTVDEFIIYKSKIYYVTYSASTHKTYLRRMSLTGENSKIMTSSTNCSLSDLKAYSDYIYFNYNDDIYKIKTTSTSKYRVVSNAEMKDLSSGYIYYTTYKNDYFYIYKMKLSSKTKTFIKKIYSLEDVKVSNGYMILSYFYESGYDSEFDRYMYNHVKYICDTNGKNGKILNRYYV